MHWILYLFGFYLTQSFLPLLKWVGFGCIVLGVCLHAGNAAPQPRGSSEGGYGGVIEIKEDDNWVDPNEIAVDCLGYGHSPNGDKWMRDSEDDDWEPYYV